MNLEYHSYNSHIIIFYAFRTIYFYSLFTYRSSTRILKSNHTGQQCLYSCLKSTSTFLLLYLLLRTCLIFEFSCPQTVSGSRQRSWRFVTKKNKKWFVLLPQLIHNWTFKFFRIFLWVSPISIFLCLLRKVEENISAFSMNNLMTLFKQFPLHSKLFLSFSFFYLSLLRCAASILPGDPQILKRMAPHSDGSLVQETEVRTLS